MSPRKKSTAPQDEQTALVPAPTGPPQIPVSPSTASQTPQVSLPETSSTPPPFGGTATITLSEKALNKIRPHTSNSQWTVQSIVEQLIMDSLHTAYSEIRYRGVELAKAGQYRSFDRRSRRPNLVLASGLGTFVISTRRENSDYAKWFEVYSQRQDANPHEKACEMCAFILQQQLEEFTEPGFAHVIYPEDFLVQEIKG